jgi:hypothetical protein
MTVSIQPIILMGGALFLLRRKCAQDQARKENEKIDRKEEVKEKVPDRDDD